MKKIIAALLGLATLEGIASAQTSPARIAYDFCYAWDYDYICQIVAGGSGVAWRWGQDSALGPKWSPDGSRVAFVAGAHILVVSLADGAITNLTNPLGGSSPAWSRDGGKIAFTSDRDGLTELYVMNADGSSVSRLTDHIGFSGRPAWSPDSSRIVFGCELEIGNQDICTINADGSGLVRLTTDPGADYGAVVSSGGIAFVTDRSGYNTIAVLEDEEMVRVVSEGTDPAWSPDGTRIAFIHIDDVLVVPAAGGSAVNVTNDGMGYYGPVWSPDGSELAFGGTFVAGYTGICYFDEGAHNADDFCIPAFGVYVGNADGSGHNLLALGGNPDWLVPSPGGPLPSFTHQCSGSVCDFDGSGSSDPDGTIASYAWQFGDGTSGSGPAPHHVYAIGDQYVVTLTVTDDTGTTGAVNMTIDANAPPVAALTAECSGPTCTFNASGSSDPDGTIATYSISFGDGHSTGAMTTPTASHAYRTGTFTATLYVRDNAFASAIQTTTITVINIPPVASFTHACNGLTCSFNASATDPDGTIHSYLWAFSDGSGGSGATAIRQFAAAGTYAVTLTVFDNSGETAVTNVTFEVNKTTPVISWSAPSAITYGTALSATQLNAGANVPGTFAYGPASGTVLGAGSQTLAVTFTPSDATHYATAAANVTLEVNKATPVITWSPPSAITYGAALTGTQLNASANMPGTFAYSPDAGTVLGAGSQMLSVTFTPADVSNYNGAAAGNSIVVAKIALSIQTNNASKVYGQALPAFTATGTGFVNGDSLASLSGTLSFSTSATATSAPGSYSVSPSGLTSANYTITCVAGTLTVTKASTSVAFTTSPNPSNNNQNVQLRAVVSAVAPGAGTPTGTVQFRKGSTLLGTATLVNGVATLTKKFSRGTHSLTATYVASTNFNGGVGSATHQTN